MSSFLDKAHFLGFPCDFPEDGVSVHCTKVHQRYQNSPARNPVLREDFERHYQSLRLTIGDANIESNEPEFNIC